MNSELLNKLYDAKNKKLLSNVKSMTCQSGKRIIVVVFYSYTKAKVKENLKNYIENKYNINFIHLSSDDLVIVE